jgi:hypothetical protein
MQVLRVVAGAVVVFSCPASKKFGEVEVIHALSGNSFVLQQTAMIYIYIHRKKCSRHNLLPPSGLERLATIASRCTLHVTKAPQLC